MKNIFKFLMIALLVASASSCDDGDAVIDQVLADVDTTSGAILRVTSEPAELVTLTNPANNFVDFTMEVQEGNGSFVPEIGEVRVYVRLYEDQDLTIPVLDGGGTAVPEVLMSTVGADEFAIDVNGLPRASVSLPTQDIVDAYPADAAITVPSFAALRLELELADGRTFTNTDVGTTISGIYFSSPFLYKIIFLNV